RQPERQVGPEDHDEEAEDLEPDERPLRGIRDAEQRIDSYPHEFSGGMLQRVMIAMALITRPELLIADEPTTALDVMVQKQVLDLIRDRQKELGTAVVLISHDLAVISEICDVVYVMYAGRVVESASARELFSSPLHAYTRALHRSNPAHQERGKELPTIPGLPPNLGRLIPGCAFAPRSETLTQEQCLRDRRPPLVETSPGHWVQDCPGCLGPYPDEAKA
ncbi:MAG: ABC transporter ATP-binding protein, partial [Verrucomicrobiota bacterium]